MDRLDRADTVRDLVDEILDVVLTVDAQGVIRYANAASEPVLGWPPDELVGRSVEAVVPLPRRSRHRALVMGYFEAPSPRPMGTRRIEGQRRDGSVIAVEVRLTPRPNRGDVVVIIRDITPLREAEQRLEDTIHEQAATNARLREIVEERNQLLGVAAHDLRNPLTTIVALADALLTDTYDQLEKSDRTGLETVIESSMYMRDLVDDLLAYSSLDTSIVQLDLQPGDLREVVEAAGRQLSAIGHHKGVRLTLELSDDLPPLAFDASKLRQVVHNLVGNAIKFTPSGGNVRVLLFPEGDSCCLKVVDEGPGLSAEEAGRIFRPFVRGDSKPTNGESSSGLGLAIVQRIVDAHGGQIRVHSENGDGATFEVCLHPQPPDPDEAAASDAPPRPLEVPLPPHAPPRSAALGLVDGLLREAPISCLLVDSAGAIVTANRRAHELFGYLPGRLRKRALRDVLPENLAEQHAQHEREFFSHPRPRAMGRGPLVRGRHALGHELTLTVGLGSVTIGGEQFALAVAEDLSDRIADRRDAEEAVRSLETRSTADRLVEESDVGLVVFSVDQPALLYSNPAARQMLSWTGAEAVLGLARSGGSTAPIRLPGVNAQGETRSVEGSVREIQWDEQAAWLVELRDATLRDRLDDQLLTIEKLGLVGQLASNVAHDFNNLLAKIQGALELARRETSSPDQIQRLAEIERSVELGAELTSRLVFLSRKSVGTVTAVDLRSVVRDIEPLMRQLVPREIGLVLELPDDVLAVEGEPVQLEQVVMNLVSNARDACLGHASGGTWIRVGIYALDPGEPFRPGGRPEADLGIARVVLEVSDNGRGIPEELREQIFEPFFTTREAGQGTGLGLASVQAVVARARGRIELSSEVGAGARFSVILPRVAGGGGVWSGSDHVVPAPGNHAVLVVDDEETIRKILVEHLRRQGLEVFEAATAVAAETLANQLDQLDLLVTDLVMPEVDGWSLMKRLQRIRPELKVVLMTGYGNDVLRAHGVDPSRVDVLHKPFRLQEATDRILEALGASAAED